jgi:hypothetical protein
MNRFLSDENVKTLWDVVIDADTIKTKSVPMKKQISELFINNIEGFYHSEKNKCSNLVEMNKKYIMYILNASSHVGIKKEINNEFIPSIKQPLVQQPYVQNVKQDMQTERQSKIDKDYQRRQQEFDNAMKLDIPSIPKFNDDKLDDGPIQNMEEILKEMSAQRKYDVYNITNNQMSNVNTNWLNSQETSIKNEKELQKKSAEESFHQIFKTKKEHQPAREQNQPLHYIKIENQELDKSIINNHLVDLNNNPKKNVSWGSNEIHNISNDSVFINNENSEDTNFLFSKLKRKNIEYEENKGEKYIITNNIDNNSNNNINNNIDNNIDNNIHENHNYMDNDDSSTNNFQEQINILSNKIDMLSENMNKILEILLKKENSEFQNK